MVARAIQGVWPSLLNFELSDAHKKLRVVRVQTLTEMVREGTKEKSGCHAPKVLEA